MIRYKALHSLPDWEQKMELIENGTVTHLAMRLRRNEPREATLLLAEGMPPGLADLSIGVIHGPVPIWRKFQLPICRIVEWPCADVTWSHIGVFIPVYRDLHVRLTLSMSRRVIDPVMGDLPEEAYVERYIDIRYPIGNCGMWIENDDTVPLNW